MNRFGRGIYFGAIASSAPVAAGYNFASEVFIFDDDDGSLATLGGWNAAPTRTNNDLSMPTAAAGNNFTNAATTDTFMTSGGFILATDSKVGFEAEILEIPTGGDGVDTLQAQFAIGFTGMTGFTSRQIEFGKHTQFSTTKLCVEDTPSTVDLSAAVGARIGIFVDATANAGVGRVGVTINGVYHAAVINSLAGWSAGERLVPYILMKYDIAAGATPSGKLRVRAVTGAANMNGGGMPTGVKDVSGVAV